MIGEAVRQRTCLIGRTSPASWGITAFSTWSLSSLRDHLVERSTVAAISRETLRRILRAGGVSWQSTSTWKASTDPDFMARMHRILDLYDHPPADGGVICVDEFGPLVIVLTDPFVQQLVRQLNRAIQIEEFPFFLLEAQATDGVVIVVGKECESGVVVIDRPI